MTTEADAATSVAAGRQPHLHDLVGLVAAPTQCWSVAGGDVTPAQIGIVHADVRVVRQAVLTVGGATPELVRTSVAGSQATFVAIARDLQPEHLDGPDPTVRLDRVRAVRPGRLTETITVTSYQDRPVRAELLLELVVDHAPMDRSRPGRAWSAPRR